jgi:ubiquinone/menaquinone biosynthesis C-methylase UbiE
MIENNASHPLGYQETQDALAIRIRAHQEYSNFSLEEWVENNLPLNPGGTLLDIGCGDGNLFPSYAEKLRGRGAIVGGDQSEELLAKAAKRLDSIPTILFRLDMNDSLPFVANSFNIVVSTFAIYYVDDVERIVTDIKRVLAPGGSLILIGPTSQNAIELYSFNEKLFGFGMDEKGARRTDRLEKEFAPALQAVFGDLKIIKIPCKLVFPGREQFIRYYLATLLYQESIKKTGEKPTREELAAAVMPFYEISKEMIVLHGQKS